MTTISQIPLSDEYSIFITKGPPLKSEKKTNVMMVYVIDNSASMGDMTRQCADSFSQIYDRDMLPGTLILFDSTAKVHSTNIRCSQDVKNIHFPGQGQTNITAGIECAIKVILEHNSSDVHYIITFLSDGGHNCGDVLDQYLLNTMHDKIKNLKVSVIVVGVINSDTSLGMLIKTKLETVEMRHLNSVYFARTSSDLHPVLEQVLVGFTKSTDLCTVVKLQIENGLFIETMSPEVSCFFSSSFNEHYSLVKHHEGILYINDVKCDTILIRDITKADITNVIDAMTPKLSQRNIASGVESIKDQVQILQTLIDTAETIFSKVSTLEVKHTDIGKLKFTPGERLQMIKKIKTAKNTFAEERNKLKGLLVTISNNSN